MEQYYPQQTLTHPLTHTPTPAVSTYTRTPTHNTHLHTHTPTTAPGTYVRADGVVLTYNTPTHSHAHTYCWHVYTYTNPQYKPTHPHLLLALMLEVTE